MSLGRYAIYVVIAAVVLSAAMPGMRGSYDVVARMIVFAVPPILLAAFMPKGRRSDFSAYWLPTIVMLIFVVALWTSQLRDLGYLEV